MQNLVIYGTDTQTVLGLDEAVILALPDEVSTADDDFEDWLEENFYTVPQQTVVPLEEIVSSYELALRAAGVPEKVIVSATVTVNDFVANSIFG